MSVGRLPQEDAVPPNLCVNTWFSTAAGCTGRDRDTQRRGNLSPPGADPGSALGAVQVRVRHLSRPDSVCAIETCPRRQRLARKATEAPAEPTCVPVTDRRSQRSGSAGPCIPQRGLIKNDTSVPGHRATRTARTRVALKLALAENLAGSGWSRSTTRCRGTTGVRW